MRTRGDQPAFPTPYGAAGTGPWAGLTVREYAAIHIHAGLLTSWPGVRGAKAAAITKEHVDALLAVLEKPTP